MPDEKIISIRVDPGDSPQKVQSVRQEIKSLRESLLEIPKESPEWAANIQRLAQLKGQILEINTITKALNPEERTNAYLKMGEGIVGAFTAAKGAAALFGEQNEELEKTMKEVEGAIALLQGIKAFDEGFKTAKAFYDVMLLNLGATKANTTALEAQTVATEGQAVATEGATAATEAFGTAWKAIGIGLLIAAIAYLVANFDNIKKSINDLLPGTDGLGKAWDKIKEIFVGVGGAVVQYVIAPFKAVYDLLHGNFSKALDDVKNGLNVVKNYEEGAAQERENIAEAHHKEMLKKQIQATDDEIKVRKARGEDTYAIEKKNLEDKLSLEEEGSKEHSKIQLDIRINDAQHQKELQDDRDKAEKERLQKLKEANEKLIAARKELADFEAKTNKESAEAAALSTGESPAVTKYKKEVVDIEAALTDELNKLKDFRQKGVLTETEYANEVAQVQGLANAKTLLAEKQKQADLQKEAKETSDKQIALLKNQETVAETQLELQRAKGLIDEKTFQAQLLKLKQDGFTQERALLVKNGQDTTAIDKQLADNALADQKLKEKNIEDARKAAQTKILTENKARDTALIADRKKTYAERLAELTKADQDIKNSTVLNEQEKTEALKENSEARKAIDKQETESKKAELQTIAGLLDSAAELLGKNTAAGKAAAIASTTISTFQSAQAAFTGMVTAVPGPAGIALGVAAAAGAVLSGLARVKAIVNTTTPGGSVGSASNPVYTAATPSYSAPTVLPQTNTTTISNDSIQDIVDASNSRDNKVYVSENDITNTQNRVNVYETASQLGGN